jgi:hypothetical protein
MMIAPRLTATQVLGNSSASIYGQPKEVHAEALHILHLKYRLKRLVDQLCYRKLLILWLPGTEPKS